MVRRPAFICWYSSTVSASGSTPNSSASASRHASYCAIAAPRCPLNAKARIHCRCARSRHGSSSTCRLAYFLVRHNLASPCGMRSICPMLPPPANAGSPLHHHPLFKCCAFQTESRQDYFRYLATAFSRRCTQYSQVSIAVCSCALVLSIQASTSCASTMIWFSSRS